MDDCGGYQDNEFVPEFYDHILAYQDPLNLAFYKGLARSAEGAVLELGCGTGRLMIPMAPYCQSITGLDLSSRMLEICGKKILQLPDDIRHKIQLVHGDMRNFNLDSSFSLITIPFLTFMHLLEVDDQIACLERAHSHLTSGGKLVVDMFNPDLQRLTDHRIGQEGAREPPFLLPDGREIVRQFRDVSIDLHGQILQAEIIYNVSYRSGLTERLVHSFPYRYFFRYELEHLLARCGFEVESVYSDFDGSPYGAGYPGELIVSSRKV